MEKNLINEYYHDGYSDGSNGLSRRELALDPTNELAQHYLRGYYDGLDDLRSGPLGPLPLGYSDELSLYDFYYSYPDLEEIEEAEHLVREEEAAEAEDEARNRAQYDYARYRKTEHWKQTAAAARTRAKHKCQRCGSMAQLEVHHLTYDRRGAELPEDLIVLCHQCHTRAHDLPPFSSPQTTL